MSNFCVAASGGKVRFPCNVEAPVVVAVGLGAGGLSLLFVIYLLMEVR